MMRVEMNPTEQRAAAKKFAERWQAAEGSEERESDDFWFELFQDVLDVHNPTHFLDRQRKVQSRKIDLFIEDTGVLIENKSRGVSLDEPEQRGKDKYGNPRFVTPFEQAKWYADNMPRSISPRWLVTCNFDEMRIYDLNEEWPEKTFETILLAEIPEQFHRLTFMIKKENSRAEREKALSIAAGEVVGKLYDAFSKAYLNIEEDKHEQRSLNILITRVVFLLYAEDADLLQERNAFYKYMKNFQVSHMRQALIDLFDVLKTPEDERDPYLSPELTAFPYVNGGLFKDDIVIPHFTENTRFMLLQEASAEFDWAGISPTIFGAVFESTLNPETRRAGGMHYTSVENIHKLTGPLFYDDLKAELDTIEGVNIEKKRKFMLGDFRKKLAGLKFLDPACGSGNFLNETYLSLRKLENRVLEDLYGDQMVLGGFEPIMVSIDQFYGIEINDFAVEVAKTALWIAELQMLDQTREILDMWIEPLPLKSNDNIHCGNALRMDWNDVLPAEECDYIIGNPPFVGSSLRTEFQTEDMGAIAFAGMKKWGKVDYCGAWYHMAAKYIDDKPIRAAFVSTNSLCQGEQVQPMWEAMFERGFHIDFAWTTFIWDSEANDKAHVHCVIVGFSQCDSGDKRLFDDDGGVTVVENINGYLSPAPNVFLRSRGAPVDRHHLHMTQGSKPVDGGNLILNDDEARQFASNPDTAAFVHEYIGAQEFMKGKKRHVLWLKDIGANACNIASVKARLDAVSETRSKSPTKEFQKYASTPWLFVQDRQPKTNYLVLPRTTSGRRTYVPLGFFNPEIIASDKLIIMPEASLYDFGLLSSLFHAAWMRVVSGRLKSDYEYSSGVYNNMAYPEATSEQRQAIEACAQAVIDARDAHPGDSLATLYDPDKMPDDLLAAHKALDAAVEAAYGVDFGGDEERIVAHLFKLYAEATTGK